MIDTQSFWIQLPINVKALVISAVAVAILGAASIVRVARVLCFNLGKPVSLDHIIRAEVDSDTVASLALQGRVPTATMLELFSESARSPLATTLNLSTIEATFDYLLERCYSDLNSVRRACALITLISFFTITYGFFPLYAFNCFLSADYPGTRCLVNSVFVLGRAVSFELASSIVLYVSAMFLEERLNRKSAWRSFLGTRAAGQLSKAGCEPSRRRFH